MAVIGPFTITTRKTGSRGARGTTQNAQSVSVNAAKTGIDSIKDELSNVKNLVYLGFIILLVMVGTLVWTAFTDWRHSGEDAMKQLNDQRYNFQQKQLQFQQNEIEFLEKTATQSAK